ncbi:hypothetical protein SAMN03159362_5685 [Pseudomonas sp. NFIX51]|uniref:hypothetical protein n=1 Tax=unclassified Pseudomonas TaxID=196821 RepID=UPI0008BD1BD5|nr:MULTISPECIES: hypothetical protein [unclassified Pseudomonas]SEM64724.1 hypothetical protein SAMN03159414_5899 [Pseudomonas sp. NFACC41-3]SMH62037.1 hypothetical protein SAMN03159362_5685 [Pseudomonas sp. NFIX51]
MDPEVFTSYEDIAKLPTTIRSIFKKFKVDILPGSDLEKYLELCERAEETIGLLSEAQSAELHHAQRVFLAIVEASTLPSSEEKTAFKSSLARIATNPLDPKTPNGSHALNMVFELEFLQYIRRRGLTAQLGEPDIVVSAPFGEYYVACKTINSLENIRRNLTKGSIQIANKGWGIIALNFEPHICFDRPYEAQTVFEVFAVIEDHLNGLYSKFQQLLDSRLASGGFDGVALQTSCMAVIAESPSDMDTVTHTVYYSRSQLQSQDASDRFYWFKHSMLGVASRLMRGY